MINNLQLFSKNIFFKLIVFLIIVSFIFWGIADIFRNFSDTSIAKVGKYKISAEDVLNTAKKDAEELQRVFGNNIPLGQLKLFNLEQSALQKLINRYLLTSFNEDMGISVGANTILAKIQSIPQFQDEQGNFSKEKFKYALLHEGINEKFILNAFSKDLPIEFVMGMIASADLIPNNLAKKLYDINNESRDVVMVTIPFDYIQNIRDPSDDEALAYYNDNQAKFKTEERREISFISFDNNDILKNLDISEDKLIKLYNERIEDFTEEETRDIYHFLVEDKNLAFEIYEYLKNNNVNDAKQKFLKNLKSENDLFVEKIHKDALPEEVADSVFEAKEKDLLEPTLSRLGWHVIIVQAINPKTTKPFDEVKIRLKEIVTKTEGDELLFNYVNQIEDSIAGGESLTSISKKYKIDLATTTAINFNKMDKDGKIEQLIPSIDNFMEVAFNSEAGVISPLLFSDKYAVYAFLKVDNIISETVMPYEDAKQIVIDSWKKTKRDEMIKDFVFKATESVKNVADLEKIANDKLFSTKKINITRNNIDENIVNKYVANKIFEMAKGDITEASVLSNGNYIIAGLVDIKKSNIDQNDQDFIKYKIEFEKNYKNDINSLFLLSLQSKYPVIINQKNLNQLAQNKGE